MATGEAGCALSFSEAHWRTPAFDVRSGVEYDRLQGEREVRWCLGFPPSSSLLLYPLDLKTVLSLVFLEQCLVAAGRGVGGWGGGVGEDEKGTCPSHTQTVTRMTLILGSRVQPESPPE